MSLISKIRDFIFLQLFFPQFSSINEIKCRLELNNESFKFPDMGNYWVEIKDTAV